MGSRLFLSSWKFYYQDGSPTTTSTFQVRECRESKGKRRGKKKGRGCVLSFCGMFQETILVYFCAVYCQSEVSHMATLLQEGCKMKPSSLMLMYLL